MNYKKIIKFVLHNLLLIIIAIIIVGSIYLRVAYANETVEEFYFYLTNNVTNADSEVFILAFKKCVLYVLALYICFYAFFYNIFINKKVLMQGKKYIEKKKKKNNKKEEKKETSNNKVLNYLYSKIDKIKNRKANVLKIEKDEYKYFQLYPFKIVNNHRIIFSLIILVIAIIFALNNIKFFEYLENNIMVSDFIEENYVVYDSDNVKFDGKKKNVIFIVVESLETTLFTKEQGGDWDYEVIPELYELASNKDSVYFSSNNTYAGMKNVTSSGWTTASVVANTSALPFKIPIDGNSYYSNDFMNGAYTFGDILKENGYHNEIISGASAEFGGIKQYLTKHGKYEIIDPDTAANFGFDKTGEAAGAWGINDKYVFEFAKTRLNKLSKSDKPFNEMLLTIDTHFPDGFKGAYTVDKYKTQYENVYATTSKLIYDFIDWCKKQPFYKDTTIVVIGDHPSMQSEYFAKYNQDLRRRYFLILNSSERATNLKNREYCALDTLPTVLSAMGVEVKDDRLGLGVNLFSEEKTLMEKYGYDYVNNELSKKSLFYNDKILGSDYYEMIKDLAN